jgi:malate/lactate dehydrogenase
MGAQKPDVTLGIIGIGKLGQAITEAFCSIDPGYQRIKKILLKGRSDNDERLKLYIEKCLVPKLAQHPDPEHLVVEQAQDIGQLAKEADIILIALRSKRDSVRYWEERARQKEFNSNIEAITNYAEAFKAHKPHALFGFVTNPMLLSYFFYRRASLEPGQMFMFTTDGVRAEQELEREIKAKPHLKGTRVRVFGDHGENLSLALEFPLGAPKIENYEVDENAIRRRVLEAGHDLMSALGSTTPEVKPHLEKLVKDILANNKSEFTLGVPYSFKEAQLVCQLPVHIEEQQPRVFRTILHHDSFANHLTKPSFAKFSGDMCADIATISSNGMKFKARYSKPLVRFYYTNELSIYDPRDSAVSHDLACKSAIRVATLEDRIAVVTKDKRLLVWEGLAKEPRQISLDYEDDDLIALALGPQGAYVGHETKNAKGVLHCYGGAKEARKLELPFIPTAIAATRARLYCADHGDKIHAFDLRNFKELATNYAPAQLDEKEWVGRLSVVSGDEGDLIFATTVNELYLPTSRVFGWKEDSKTPFFTAVVANGAFDAQCDQWGNNILLLGQGDEIQLGMVGARGRDTVDIVQEMKIFGDARSLCFDPRDNYVYVATKSHLLAIPYYKGELKKAHTKITTFQEKDSRRKDVRDVWCVQLWE